ncbi:MAG: VOC family protein [Proteobacteria bacterium]|nr:VOC family protein [Pseudomonadota bacterium]MDA0995016.1 VOC family protein [Pseudomonadota bacterium]
MDLNQVTLPCTDYSRSVEFYRKLGFQLVVDSPPRYTRFETEKGTTFSIHAQESNSCGNDIVVYFEVNDVDRVVGQLKSLGLEFEKDPEDQDWLWREAYIRDPSGNLL